MERLALCPLSGTGGDQFGRNVTILDRPVRTVPFELLNAQLVRNSPYLWPVEEGMFRIGLEGEGQFASAPGVSSRRRNVSVRARSIASAPPYSLTRSMVDVNGGVSHHAPLPETSKLNMTHHRPHAAFSIDHRTRSARKAANAFTFILPLASSSPAR